MRRWLTLLILFHDRPLSQFVSKLMHITLPFIDRRPAIHIHLPLSFPSYHTLHQPGLRSRALRPIMKGGSDVVGERAGVSECAGKGEKEDSGGEDCGGFLVGRVGVRMSYD